MELRLADGRRVTAKRMKVGWQVRVYATESRREPTIAVTGISLANGLARAGVPVAELVEDQLNALEGLLR